jgi:hypothetical protein
MATRIPGARALGGRLSLPSAPSTPAQYDPIRQAEGYTRRLEEGLGVDVEKELDKRGPIKKLLNLREDQNFVFDVFEAIGRSQQALFAGLQAGATGDDPFLAMQRGLTGNQRTRFAEVLQAYGADSSRATEIVGFLGDVFLDPVNIPLFMTGAPIAKGALTVKKSQAISKSTAQSAKLVKAAKTAGSGLTDVVKSADDILTVTEKGLKAKKVLGKATKGADIAEDVLKKAIAEATNYENLNRLVGTVLEGETYARRVSALRLAGGQVKKGLGATINFTDSSAGKVLRKIDEANGIVFNNDNIRSFKDFASMEALPEGVRQSLFQNYYEMKNTVLSTFDFVKILPENVLNKLRKVESQFDLSKANVDKKAIQVNAMIDRGWETLQAATDDAGNILFQSREEFSALIQRAVEYKYRYNPKILGTISVDELLSNDGHRITEEAFNTLNEIAKRSGIGDLTVGTIGEGIIKKTGADGISSYQLSEALRKQMIQTIGTADTTVLNTQLSKASFYDKEMIDFLDKILNNKQFNNLITEVADELQTFQGAITAFQKQAKIEKFTERGYVRHTFNPEFEQLRRIPELTGDLDTILPRVADDAVLKTGNVKAIAERQFKMSAYEANQVMQDFIREKISTVDLSEKSKQILESLQGKEMFIESLEASLTDWVQEIPKLVKDASLLDEILVKMSVTIDDAGTAVINPNSDVMVLNFTGGRAAPPGYTLYSHDKLITTLDKVTKVVDSPEMVATLEYLKGLAVKGNAAIDNQVFSMLQSLGDKKGPNAFIRAIESFNNIFKKYKLLSPGFQMRNNIGNSTNMWLAGVPVQEIPRNWHRAHKMLKQAPEITQKVMNNIPLSGQEQVVYDYFQRLINNGFLYSAESLYDISDEILSMGRNLKKTDPRLWAEKIVNINNNLNQAADVRYRLGLMIYADQTPAILERAGVRTAEDLVRRALFDPKAISPLERQVIKRIIPFYTWAKKNLAWQMKNVLDNPERYNRLQSSIEGSWNLAGIDWEDIEQYKKDNFWIPAPFLSDGNKYTAIRANLPVRGLTEFASSPLRNVIGITSPLVRVPFELATGSQIFTQRNIQDFPGQRGYNFDFLTRRQEYILSQTGLDVPARTIQGLVQGGQRLMDPSQQFSPADLLPSALAEGSLDRAREGRGYDYLAQVRDLYAYYRQEAGEIPTIAEIENRNRNMTSLKKRVDRLKIR